MLTVNTQVGDAVPNVDLFEGTPGDKVNLADVCKEGKVVIFGVPGAFTPGCSKTHLPGNWLGYHNNMFILRLKKELWVLFFGDFHCFSLF